MMLEDSPAARPDDPVDRIRQLEEALQTRTVIARAQGMLMERYEIGADAAFEALKRISSQTNLPVREVARSLVETRHLPGIDNDRSGVR
jgi:AmiR/NasT family two-component response regulator